ncbi:MAG: phosphopantetheine-binding protein [Myxococcota bacterium]|nr:phosphopantetheine-binding protein [Myxococcota bacterium]
MDEKLKRAIEQRAHILKIIKQDLITRLNLSYEPEDLHEDVSLLGSGLGLDSLDALEVILGIEHAFDVKVEEDNIAILRSINSIADYVLETRGAVEGSS